MLVVLLSWLGSTSSDKVLWLTCITSLKAPNFSGDFVLWQHCGQHTPTELGFSLVISTCVTQPRAGSTRASADALFAPSPALLKLLSPSSHVRTCGVTAPSARCPALIALSSISRWLSCVISNAIPIRLGPLAINRYPAVTSPSGSRKQMDHPVIWRWLTTSFFITLIALDQLKVAFHSCAKEWQGILTNTPTPLGAKLLVPFRAYRNGLSATVKQCCEFWEPVARCFDPHFVECVNFRALCHIVESLARDNIRAYEEELLGLDVNQAEKDIILSKCVSSQQCWAARKPKHTIHATSSADDVPIFDLDVAARSLRQHWCGIFSARDTSIQIDCAETVLAGISGLTNSKNFLLPNANLFLDQMVCLTVCIALLAVLGQKFSSLLSRLPCRERLSLLYVAPADQFPLQSLLKSTPRDVLSVRLKPCVPSLYATAIAK